jgi:hypothetical protein
LVHFANCCLKNNQYRLLEYIYIHSAVADKIWSTTQITLGLYKGIKRILRGDEIKRIETNLGIPMKTTSIEHGLNGLDGLTRVFSFLKII